MQARSTHRNQRIDDRITAYIDSRRARIIPFIENNFALDRDAGRFRNRLTRDLGPHLANSLTVLPYLAIKKIAYVLDRLGWDWLQKLSKKLPPGFKTSMEKDFERLLFTEFFEVPADAEETASHRNEFLMYLESDGAELRAILRKELYDGLHEWVDRRARWVDYSSSGLVWITGFLAFDDIKLGVFEIGQKIASGRAYQSSSSDFILGTGAGKVFYRFFPPEPSHFEVMGWTLALMTVFACATFVFSIALDPLQKKLGLHDKNLHKLLDSLEVKLLLAVRDLKRNRIKPG